MADILVTQPCWCFLKRCIYLLLFLFLKETVQVILRVVLCPLLFSLGRTCPWPLPPSETSEARLLSPAPAFSALLEVRCRPGLTSPSGSDVVVRRCQGDRQWSGDEPICTGGLVCSLCDDENAEQQKERRGAANAFYSVFRVNMLFVRRRNELFVLVCSNKSDWGRHTGLTPLCDCVDSDVAQP